MIRTNNMWWIRLAKRITKIRPDFIVSFYRLTFLWGLFISIPYFHAFSTNPAFSFMAKYASEQIWGGIMMAIALYLHSAYKSKRTVSIRNGLFLTFCLWTLITTMLLVASRSTGSVVTYPLITYNILREFLIYSQRVGEEKYENVAT